MLRLKEHDDVIRSFLKHKEVFEILKSSFRSGSSTPFLKYILGIPFSSDKSLKLDTIATAIDINTSEILDTIRPDVNIALKDFCERYEIHPPIQLYSRTLNINVGKESKAGYANVGTHFTCSSGSKTSSDSKTQFSGVLEDIDNLNEMLTNALCTISQEVIDNKSQKGLEQAQKVWQDLYREYMVDPIYSPSSGWITLSGLKAETEKATASLGNIARRSALTFSGQPQSVYEMVQRNKSVLLTGDAGSGKTTSLKILMNSMLVEKHRLLPLYINLKELESYLIEFIKRARCINTAEMIGKGVAMHLLRRINKQPESQAKMFTILQFYGKTPSIHLTYIDRLNRLSALIASWFENVGYNNEDTLLLLDGLNELIPSVRSAVVITIKELLECNCKLVLACRSNISINILSSFSNHLNVFKLQPLSEDSIISYLNFHIPGKGRDIYHHEFSRDVGILSMAEIPFFLHLLTAKVTHQPEQQLPAKRTQLIEDFVNESIDRKVKGTVTGDKQSLINSMIRVLAEVAHWYMKTITVDKKNSPLSFWSSDLLQNTQHTDTEVCDSLELAETCGLLSFSGLLQESPDRFEYPQFLHDNFRDYFAAKHLMMQPKLSYVPYLNDFLEYFECDNALYMYFELLQDSVKVEDAIRTIAHFDPFLAASCLKATRKHYIKVSEELLSHFSNDKYSMLLQEPFDNSPYNIISTIANILSTYTTEDLLELYNDKAVKTPVKRGIPYALVMKLGIYSLEHLINIADSIDIANGVNEISVFLAIASIRSSTSWEYLCLRYIEAIKYDCTHKSESCRLMIELPLCHINTFADIDTIRRLLEQAQSSIVDDGINMPRPQTSECCRLILSRFYKSSWAEPRLPTPSVSLPFASLFVASC